MTIKVLVVDDQPVVQEGLQRFFQDTPVTACLFAGDCAKAVEEFRRQKPQVVLLEPRLKTGDGFDVLEQLMEIDAKARVIVFTSFDYPTNIARAAALGAKEFLLKTATPQCIVQTIRLVASDEANPEGSLITEYRRNLRRRRNETAENTPLTNRELQVLRHIGMGLSNREIGKSLEISIETVKEHVQNILRKLDVSDRTQAAVWAVRRELI